MDNCNLEGYESPISMIVHKNATKILEEREDAIVARISEEIGLDINKEELIKALEYDRNQYSRGYADGYRRAQSVFERPQGEWVGDTDYESYQGHYESYKCSNCGYGLHWRDYYADKYNFCPNCGAEMSGDKE